MISRQHTKPPIIPPKTSGFVNTFALLWFKSDIFFFFVWVTMRFFYLKKEKKFESLCVAVGAAVEVMTFEVDGFDGFDEFDGFDDEEGDCEDVDVGEDEEDGDVV